VTAALEHVARSLQAAGADVRDIHLPTLGEFGAVNRVILQSEPGQSMARGCASGPAIMEN